MDAILSLSIVALAGLINASFSLSVSVLTLLSGNRLGLKTSHRHLLNLTSSFVLGAALVTILLIATTALIIIGASHGDLALWWWYTVCAIMAIVGLLAWIFYYRPGKVGTSLWTPRGFSNFLYDRTKSTHSSAEAFSLGVSSVISELPFIIAPLLVSASALIGLQSGWQLLGILVYTLFSSLGILIVWTVVGSGHKLSSVQKWREQNKRFLQFSSGAGLIILAAFVYVYIKGVNL